MENGPDISIVIPAHNEAERLPGFLASVVAFCAASSRRYEVIVVDDGSTDGSSDAVSRFQKECPRLRIIRNDRNRGKGYAVKRGLLEAKGRIRVYLDADGSVGPEEIEKNVRLIEEGSCDVFVGSRAVRSVNNTLHTKFYRVIIGRMFAFVVRCFLLADIKDSQCGFKMMSSEVVKDIFPRLKIDGFGFDMEFIYLAIKHGYTVREEAISWSHVPGSKVNLIVDPLKMLINVFQIRRWHKE